MGKGEKMGEERVMRLRKKGRRRIKNIKNIFF